jgi:peptide-methionine (S)-S-oxide reductase
LKCHRTVLLLALTATLAACQAHALPELAPAPPGSATAIFAGGCFWCSEVDFEKVEGVLTVVSGYIGGPEQSPSYKQVSSGRTGHTEAVRVIFDPKRVSYEQLVEKFWKTIDPTQRDGQFCDRGAQYRSGIFFLDDAQKEVAQGSKAALEKSGKLPAPVVTEVTAATTFWVAEEYHQDFYKKEPSHYLRYRQGCGRDQRLLELWGK